APAGDRARVASHLDAGEAGLEVAEHQLRAIDGDAHEQARVRLRVGGDLRAVAVDGVEAVGIEVAEDARGIAAEEIAPRLELRGVDVDAAFEEPAPLDAAPGVELDAALRVETRRAARGVGLLHAADSVCEKCVFSPSAKATSTATPAPDSGTRSLTATLPVLSGDNACPATVSERMGAVTAPSRRNMGSASAPAGKRKVRRGMSSRGMMSEPPSARSVQKMSRAETTTRPSGHSVTCKKRLRPRRSVTSTLHSPVLSTRAAWPSTVTRVPTTATPERR